MGWVKCSNCTQGGNGNGSCKYGDDVKRCAEDVGCVTTGTAIKKGNIGELGQHCGHCSVIDYCGDPFYYCLCQDDRFLDMKPEKYKILAGKIDWEGFEKHGPCIGCIGNHCDGCEEEAEEKDARVRYIADKMALELLRYSYTGEIVKEGIK